MVCRIVGRSLQKHKVWNIISIQNKHTKKYKYNNIV